ncbi:MAG: PD-(D/E)XK nuclease family protein [Akkermansiaceae bacterium]
MSEVIQALGALKTLSEKIRELQVRAEERLIAQHGRFNVFTTLLKASDEVRLHTRFIHELLNPEGTHDCGDLFIKLFFETLKVHPPIDHNDSTTAEPWDDYSEQTYWVSKEVRKGQSQLDILLESDSHLLVIENKIWAGEQENQIGRYIEYLESQQLKNSQVLYLTLEGKQTETHNNKAYLRISYRTHIMAWLESCLQATYHIVSINQVLIQYKDVIKQLTGQQLEAKTMESIKEYIRNHPVIIKNHNDISEAIRQLHIEILDEFASAVIAGLKDDFTVRLRQGMTADSFGQDNNRGLVVDPHKDFYNEDHSFEIWIEHNKWWGWAIGIETDYDKKRPIREDELEMLRKKIYPRLSQLYHDAEEHYTDATKTWNGTYWPCGWHNIVAGFMCGTEAIAQIFEPTHFAQQVQTTVNDVRTFIDRFKQIYLDEVKNPQN